MISFTDLQPRLVNAVQLTARDVEYDCPRCGGRATVRSFGSRWSAKCPKCENLGEEDFAARAKSTDRRPDVVESPIESRTSSRAQASISAAQRAQEGALHPFVPENPTLHANGAVNGVLGPSDYDRRSNLNDWRMALAGAAYRFLRNDPEYADKASPAQTFLEPLTRDLLDTVHALKGTGGVLPPVDLDESGIHEECEREARLAIEDWLGTAIWSVPAVQNGNGKSPVAEPLVIPWEGFNQALVANEAYLKRVAIVDRLCFSSSVAMITGGKHAGKSTLARWMAVCVAKGWPFLGRDVSQGPVFYVASEDETMAARQELIRLGWGADDPLRFLSAQNIPYEDLDAFLMRLTDEIRESGTVMCVLDMLFDFVRITDEMSYASTREAVGKIQKVASNSESLIVTSHHAPKHMNTADAAVTALGSQGLAARVSPIILVKKHGPDVHSIVSTSVRDPRGEAIEQSRLVRNSDGSMTLGGIWKDWMQAEVYRPQVLEVLEAEDDAEMTAADVAEQLEITYKLAAAALVRLYKDGKVARKGSGLKGKPYRYQIISDANPRQGEKDVSQGKGAIQTEPTPHPNAQGAFGYKED